MHAGTHVRGCNTFFAICYDSMLFSGSSLKCDAFNTVSLLNTYSSKISLEAELATRRHLVDDLRAAILLRRVEGSKVVLEDGGRIQRELRDLLCRGRCNAASLQTERASDCRAWKRGLTWRHQECRVRSTPAQVPKVHQINPGTHRRRHQDSQGLDGYTDLRSTRTRCCVRQSPDSEER